MARCSETARVGATLRAPVSSRVHTLGRSDRTRRECCAICLEQRPISSPALCHRSHGVSREAYLPAQCPSPIQEAWFSCSDEHACRTRRPEVSSRQGSGTPLGVIGPIRSRTDFQRLRRHGRRTRLGPFWCAHLTTSVDEQVLVAFAINRAVGNAVTRNRLRRRLRAIVADLGLPPGLYLFGCRPAANELTFDKIRSTLVGLPAQVATA